jgi:hypothetical protein
MDPASGRVSQPSLPGRSSAPPTLTQKITALVETGMHLASAATGGLLGAVGGGLGAFAGSATSGGLRRQPDGSVPALDVIGTGAKEGAAGLTYNPRSELGQERAAQAAEGLSQLAPLGGLPAEAAALSSASRMVGRDLRTAGSAALDANRKFNATRAVAKDVKAAKEAALAAPERAGIEAAHEAGYKLTPKAANAGVGARMTQTAAGSGRLEKEFSAHNAENTSRLARQDVGLPDDVPATPEATAAIRKQEGENYAAVKDVGRFENDAQYGKDLDNITKPYTEAAKDFPELLNNPIIKRVEGLRKADVDSASAIEVVKDLRNEADKAFRAGDKKLGASYRAAASAVDNSMDRALTRMAETKRSPELADAVSKYQAARVRIAKTYLLDEAMDGKPGEVNAMAYKRALEKGAKLTGGAKQIAEFAKQFGEEGLAQKKGKSGGTGPDFRDILLAALHGPTTALAALVARPGARAALGSEFMQKRMAGKKPQAPTPKPELTAEQSPFPAREGSAPPAGPLGDLTPDWETAPGATAPAGRQEVIPAEGLVPAAEDRTPPMRVAPSGQDRAPGKQAGKQIPAVSGRPGQADTMVGGPPKEVAATDASGRAMQDALATIDEFEARNPGKIPVGEATEVAPTDPRLAEIEQLQQGAKSEAVRKALTAEAAKLKREIKAQAEAEKLKADVAELRQVAASVKDVKLKERLLARADDLEKAEKIPVGEVIEGQPEIKAEKVGKIPVGKATEVPDEPATGRAPEMEKLPTGEATHVTDSGVEEAIPVGEAKELFTPPGKGEAKAPEAEVRLEKGPRGQLEGFDKKGDPYQVKVSEQMLGADKKEKAILVEIHDPVTGQRRGFVDFAIRKDGTLVAENVKVAPYLKKRGLAELMYRAARDAGHDIAPGRVQTEEGLALVEALQRKKIINKEAEGPRAKASDLKEKQDAAGQVSKPEGVQQERVQGDEGRKTAEAGGRDRVQRPAGSEEKALPEGVTLRPMKSGGFEAVNKQGNRIGRVTSTGEVTVDNAFAGKGIVQALRDAMKKPRPKP